MLVTLSGIVTLVNRLRAKAAAPMLVTLSGIVTLVSWLFAKAAAPMLVTPAGMASQPPSWLFWKA